MEIHKSLCLKNETCKIILPAKGKNEHLLRFKNIKNCHKADAYLVADFETTLIEIPEEEKHNTERIEQVIHHVPNSFALYYKSHRNVQNFFSLEHSDTKEELISCLIDQLKFYAVNAFNAALEAVDNKFDWTTLTPHQKDEFENATHCTVCLTQFLQ